MNDHMIGEPELLPSKDEQIHALRQRLAAAEEALALALPHLPLPESLPKSPTGIGAAAMAVDAALRARVSIHDMPEVMTPDEIPNGGLME